jgi:hypothetical protein
VARVACAPIVCGNSIGDWSHTVHVRGQQQVRVVRARMYTTFTSHAMSDVTWFVSSSCARTLALSPKMHFCARPLGHYSLWCTHCISPAGITRPVCRHRKSSYSHVWVCLHAHVRVGLEIRQLTLISEHTECCSVGARGGHVGVQYRKRGRNMYLSIFTGDVHVQLIPTQTCVTRAAGTQFQQPIKDYIIVLPSVPHGGKCDEIEICRHSY